MSRTEPAPPAPPAPPVSLARRVVQGIDAGDVVVVIGLLLWAVGFWPETRVALGVPGLVLVWYGLPSRPWFFDHGTPRR